MKNPFSSLTNIAIKDDAYSKRLKNKTRGVLLKNSAGRGIKWVTCLAVHVFPQHSVCWERCVSVSVNNRCCFPQTHEGPSSAAPSETSRGIWAFLSLTETVNSIRDCFKRLCFLTWSYNMYVDFLWFDEWCDVQLSLNNDTWTFRWLIYSGKQPRIQRDLKCHSGVVIIRTTWNVIKVQLFLGR